MRRNLNASDRRTMLMSLSMLSSGEIPPCTQRNRLSRRAASGREQKEVMQAS